MTKVLIDFSEFAGSRSPIDSCRKQQVPEHMFYQINFVSLSGMEREKKTFRNALYCIFLQLVMD